MGKYIKIGNNLICNKKFDIFVYDIINTYNENGIKNNINIDDGMIKDRLTLKKNLLKHADNYINAGGNLKDGNLLIEDQTWKDALSLWQDLDQNSNLYKMWKSITTKERQKRLVEENLFYYRGFIGMSFR